MEEPINPFAPSAIDEEIYAPTQQRAVGGLSTPDGRLLLAEDGAAFPDRCVVCNAPASGYRKHATYSWHPRWVFLLVLLNLLIYVVVALLVRKQVKLAVGLCEEHRSKRRRWLTIWWLALPLSVVGLIAGAAAEAPAGLVLGVIGMFVSLIGLIVSSRVLVTKKIEGRLATLSGASPAFLASLGD